MQPSRHRDAQQLHTVQGAQLSPQSNRKTCLSFGKAHCGRVGFAERSKRFTASATEPPVFVLRRAAAGSRVLLGAFAAVRRTCPAFS